MMIIHNFIEYVKVYHFKFLCIITDFVDDDYAKFLNVLVII